MIKKISDIGILRFRGLTVEPFGTNKRDEQNSYLITLKVVIQFFKI